MSGKQGLTLTISNGGAQVQTSRSCETPKADNRNRLRDKRTTCADLAVVYAGLFGVELARQDVLETLERHTSNSPEDEVTVLALSLRGAGLLAQTADIETLDGTQCPALACMTSGQIVLVLAHEGECLVIYDRTCPDHRARVPVAEFAQHFAGTILRADLPLETVATRHLSHVRNHWFWGEFLSFKGLMAEVALGSFVANLLAVAVALFSLQVYDRVIPHQSEATLWVLAIGACMALLLEGFLKIARARLMDGAGRQIELNVLSLLMQRVLGARSDRQRMSPSETFNAMRDFGSVREFFTAATIGTLADIPFLFVFLALVAFIAGPVVWVLIAGGILMVVPGFFLQRRMMRLTAETQGASAKSARLLQEVIFERDTVKTQRAEDRVLRLWQELTTLSAIKSSEQRKIASALSFWSQGMQQMTYVAAVIAGTFLVFAGEFTVGTIIAVGILTSRTLSPLTQLAGTMARWGNVRTALDALEQVADTAQDVEEGRTYLRRDRLDGRYDLREVTFRYAEDAATTLDIPALRIRQGQRIAVLGANGVGKSSFLKLLTGLYAPTHGRILLDGTEKGQVAPKDLRRLIGYLGQDVRLFAGSLRDNLNLSLLERDEARLFAALDFAGLGPFVRNHPQGLDLPVFDGGHGLSIGQRQSIGWARLWLQDPRICLLDEPTAALDQRLEQTLVDRLDTWLAGRTALIATHRAPILALADRAIVLQQGRLVVDGPRDEVLRHMGQSGLTVARREATV